MIGSSIAFIRRAKRLWSELSSLSETVKHRFASGMVEPKTPLEARLDFLERTLLQLCEAVTRLESEIREEQI